jgi:carbonic anhydrase
MSTGKKTCKKLSMQENGWQRVLSPLTRIGYKAGETIKTYPLVPKDIIVRGFVIDSETGALEEIKTIDLFP